MSINLSELRCNRKGIPPVKTSPDTLYDQIGEYSKHSCGCCCDSPAGRLLSSVVLVQVEEVRDRSRVLP